ncbi:MAG: penicillin-binding protein 2 [Holosporales bacterium]|jgi:penicillin-binding protein 2|nr:penicillin-binding protein 2 [Holosporales bacterium]
MNNKRDEKVRFIKRVLVFSWFSLILTGVVLSRLVYLQIFNADHYKLLSDKNRIVVKQVLPTRGMILDSDGKILAKNVFSYYVVLDLFGIAHKERNKVIDALISDKSLNLKESAVEFLKNLPERINNANRLVLLQENLDWNALSKYYVMSSTTPGIIIEKTQRRNYLYPREFSHVIGYIGAPTKDEANESKNTALLLPAAKIGKTCIEKEYNDSLFGKAGIQSIEVNSKRQFVRVIDNTDPIPGDDVTLTVNLDLELEVYRILSQHESASCIVMDVNSGAILACVSYPGYDANIFTKKIKPNVLKELYDNPYNPMINKTIAGLYSPGSIFKLVTALAALKKGVINKHTRFVCQDFYELGNRKFHCWKGKYGGHGSVNLQEAIAQSCDVYFYNIARMLTPEEIAETARELGLGEVTGVDIPNEKSGLIPTKSWKKEKKKQSWTTGDTFNMSIGQGFVLTTPLQLLKTTALLANGMKPITPRFVKHKETENLENQRPVKYNNAHLQIILDGMRDAVNSSLGTARNSVINDEDFKLAGKTGSSQVFGITEQQRKLGKTVSDDYWKKEHAVFAGYAPADDPKVAVVVLVEHGGGGARIAAPIAREVLLAAKKILENAQ